MKAAFGTFLYRGDGASPTETFVKITHVTDINGPGLSRLMLDATDQDSPSGYEEIEPGVKKLDPVTFTLNFDAAETTHLALQTDFEAGTKRNWRVAWPKTGGTRTRQFVGCVSNLVPAGPVKGGLSMNCTITPTGAPTDT